MVEIMISHCNYCVTKNDRYFRSKFNGKWYNCKVRGMGEDWWRYASFTDAEMLEKGATADTKRVCDKGWNMCY